MEHIFLHCLWTACRSPINHCFYGGGRRSDTAAGVLNEGWERWRREPCIRLLSFSAGWPHKPCYPFLFCFSCHLPFGFHLGRQTSFFFFFQSANIFYIGSLKRPHLNINSACPLALSPSFPGLEEVMMSAATPLTAMYSNCSKSKEGFYVSLMFTWFVVPLNASLRRGCTICMATHSS